MSLDLVHVSDSQRLRTPFQHSYHCPVIFTEDVNIWTHSFVDLITISFSKHLINKWSNTLLITFVIHMDNHQVNTQITKMTKWWTADIYTM